MFFGTIIALIANVDPHGADNAFPKEGCTFFSGTRDGNYILMKLTNQVGWLEFFWRCTARTPLGHEGCDCVISAVGPMQKYKSAFRIVLFRLANERASLQQQFVLSNKRTLILLMDHETLDVFRTKLFTFQHCLMSGFFLEVVKHWIAQEHDVLNIA